MEKLKVGDLVEIISCSNGIKIQNRSKVIELKTALEEMGLEVIVGDYVFENDKNRTYSGKKRAEDINKAFKNRRIKAIFDISGGDLANEILEYIDYKMIKENHKYYFGISDLSVILNALYKKSDLITYHYAPKNLIIENKIEHLEFFRNSFFEKENDLFDINYEFIRGEILEGVVVGGNIRCFMKLIGTEYIPDLKNKIILLESFSGGEDRFRTLFTQLKQMGYFEMVAGVILGEFYDMEINKNFKKIESIFLEISEKYNFPIVKTSQIGHGSNCKGICIGKNIKILKH